MELALIMVTTFLVAASHAGDGGVQIPYLGVSPAQAVGVGFLAVLFWRVQRSLVHDQAERIKTLNTDVAAAEAEARLCRTEANDLRTDLTAAQHDAAVCEYRLDGVLRLLDRNGITPPPMLWKKPSQYPVAPEIEMELDEGEGDDGQS